MPRITDAKVIAAMTHPLRQRLLAVLRLDGPSTVGVLAQRLGQAPGNISHHLKALAAAGLVEEVPELARATGANAGGGARHRPSAGAPRTSRVTPKPRPSFGLPSR